MSDITATLGLPPDDVAEVLTTAGLAPSLHNSQPWAFRVTPDAIELHADPDRRLSAADGQDRELRIACGAVLLNLRLALQGKGVRPEVTRMPDHTRPGFVAEIRRGGAAPVTPEAARLLAAVPLRATNRRPFSAAPVTEPDQQELRRAAVVEGGALYVVRDGIQRRQLQELAGNAHRTQLADPAFRAELARWTGTVGDRPDGVPVHAGGPLPAPHDRWVLRDFTGGAGRDRLPGKDFEEEPLIAVLSATFGGPRGDVQAGEALQRVLLTATADGLAVSYLSQLVEVAEVRAAVHRLVRSLRPPQVVLRIGHGSPGLRTPRRPVTDLLRDPAGSPQR